jgi:hypothetical protein
MKFIKLLSVAALAVVCFIGCAQNGTQSGNGGAADTVASIEKALPLIKTGATLAMGAGLRYGVDDAHREKIANLSWSICHGAWQLTDGKVPTADNVAKYLLAFDYELDDSIKADYALIVNSIAGLYAGYYNRINGDAALAIKVLNAIAEGAAAGSQAYATVK